MQGIDKVYLVHLPMFYMANHRYQVIITGDLPPDVMDIYVAAKKKNPGQFFTLSNQDDATLPELISEGGSFKAVIDIGLPKPDQGHLAEDFLLTNIRVLINNSLDSNSLKTTYPSLMPFYLYGTSKEQHVDHILRMAPNQLLNSDQVTLRLSQELTEEELANGVVAVLTDVWENSMQPM